MWHQPHQWSLFSCTDPLRSLIQQHVWELAGRHSTLFQPVFSLFSVWTPGDKNTETSAQCVSAFSLVSGHGSLLAIPLHPKWIAYFSECPHLFPYGSHHWILRGHKAGSQLCKAIPFILTDKMTSPHAPSSDFGTCQSEAKNCFILSLASLC